MPWIIQILSEIKDQLALTRREIEEIKEEASNRHAQVEQGFREMARAITDLSQVVTGLQAGLNAGAMGAPQLQPWVPPPPPPQPPAPQLGASGIKMAKPDRFDRTKREKAVDFQISCSLFLRTVHASATPEQQMNFIMSYLEGTAREWLRAHLDNEIIQNVWIPWLHDVTMFWQEFLNKGYKEAKAALTIAQENMAKYYNQKHRAAPKFSPGAKAWLDAQNIQTDRPSRKLSHKHSGPYEIIKQIGKASYCLKLPSSMKVHPVFHVSLLYPHPTDNFNRWPIPPPPVVTPEGEEEYKVEKIINSRKVGWKVEYWVRWKGYGPEEDTWEPWENLNNAQDALRDFLKAHPDTPQA
jgi:hypothetical protein